MTPMKQARQERQLYMLAIVDEATGMPVRAATEEDVAGVSLKMLELPPVHKKGAQQSPAAEDSNANEGPKQPTLQELLAIARMGPGPKCDHCKATGECGKCWLGNVAVRHSQRTVHGGVRITFICVFCLCCLG